MSYIRDRVIVLKKEPFREQDRRYVVYGRVHGLLIAVARGSSGCNSKQAGHLEPFSESEVMIAKGSAFDKLAVAKLIEFPFSDSLRRIHSSPLLAAYSICGAFADLVHRLTLPGIADERIFFLLQELIQTAARMQGDPSPDRARLMLSAATLRLLDLLGFAPQIERAPEGATPVPSLSLVAFLRQISLEDVLKITARRDVFQAASQFIEEALAHTPLQREPHGLHTIHAILH